MDFLTFTYNESLILTYDLASGGATVDADLIAPSIAGPVSLKNQIESEFIPIYASRPYFAPWGASDTLFALFIGINDVQNTYGPSKENKTRVDETFQEYAGLLDQLYQSGARNYLLLNVPPVNRSPVDEEAGAQEDEEAQKGVEAWNKKLNTMAANLSSTYHDSTVYAFDTYTLFNTILRNPRSFEQTRHLKNLTDYCPEYANGTPYENVFYPECGIPLNQYFWRNSLHVTYPVHNATAAEIVNLFNSKGTTPYGKLLTNAKGYTNWWA